MSSSISLMPHARCWAADPQLIWTMVVTNSIIFLSYASICTTLLVLVRRTRRVIARDWAWFCVGFALFIVACGTTHLMDVVTTWVPVFWINATACIITAILSATVAVMLMRRVAIIGFSINDYASRLANAEMEKQQMEASLLSARKLEDWSRMSTAVTHEISNPLETIQNLLYLIRNMEGTPPEAAELARTAAEEADRVATISRSTLSFFRQTQHPEVLDLSVAVDSVKFLLTTLLSTRGITLKVEKRGDLTVEAFAGEIRQALLNLIRNAAEATTHPGSQITVSLTGKAEGVSVVVEDQAGGMPAEILGSLFEFGKSTKGEQGNGMGLWTVKHILTRHGGTVDVKSTPGQGTRFSLWWPRNHVAYAPANAVTEGSLSADAVLA